MADSFRSRLLGGQRLLGTMVTLTAPEVSELLAGVGFDWLFIDGEHGPFDTKDIQSLLQAVGKTAACLVRIPSIDEVPIKKALDLGASGIIVPQVNTADDAARVVEFCRYAPLGRRGIGLARAHGYGSRFREYLENANQEVAVVVQAEDRTAVENIESIVTVPGIDCVMVGPNDLSASYGKLGQFDDPQVVAAIGRIEDVCKQAKIPLGIFGIDASAVRPYYQRGFTLIVAAIDALLLRNSAQRLFDDMQ